MLLPHDNLLRRRSRDRRPFYGRSAARRIRVRSLRTSAPPTKRGFYLLLPTYMNALGITSEDSAEDRNILLQVKAERVGGSNPTSRERLQRWLDHRQESFRAQIARKKIVVCQLPENLRCFGNNEIEIRIDNARELIGTIFAKQESSTQEAADRHMQPAASNGVILQSNEDTNAEPYSSDILQSTDSALV